MHDTAAQRAAGERSLIGRAVRKMQAAGGRAQ